MRIRSVAVAWTAGMSAALSVTACQPDAPAQKSVWGHRDDIRHVERVTKKDKVKKYDSKCLRMSRAERRRKNITCKKPWFETVVKTVRPEAWCVELDDVNGSAKDDDVWYTTTRVVYLKAASLSEGDTIKFLPLHGGCW